MPPRTTAPLPRSTPIKVGSSTTCPFTTNQKFRVDACTGMGEEIKKYLVGLMPAQQFLNNFFPVNELSGLDIVPQFKRNCYRCTVRAKNETGSYDHFISPFDGFPYAGSHVVWKVKSTQSFTPDFRIVNPSSCTDCNPCSDFPFKIKPDVSVYHTDSDPKTMTDSA